MRNFLKIFLLIFAVFVLYNTAKADDTPIFKKKVTPRKETQEVPKIIKQPPAQIDESCSSPNRRFIAKCTIKDKKAFVSICKESTVKFAGIDSVADKKYRSVSVYSTNKNEKTNLGYGERSNLLSGDESGEKMTYGLALRICDVRGMRLPSLAELYSAMINKSNDECALKQDEYWSEAAGWKFDDGSARGFIVTTYSPSSGLSAVSPEEYRRVRCVEK